MNRSNAVFRETAMKLSPGQVSNIFELDNSFYIIKCIEKKDQGYISFDKIKNGIQLSLLNQKYNEMIDKLIKESKLSLFHLSSLYFCFFCFAFSIIELIFSSFTASG